MLLGRIAPEAARNVESEHRAGTNGQQCQEPLRSLGDLKAGSIALELEATKEAQLERSIGRSTANRLTSMHASVALVPADQVLVVDQVRNAVARAARTEGTPSPSHGRHVSVTGCISVCGAFCSTGLFHTHRSHGSPAVY